MNITDQQVELLIKTVDQGLVYGLGKPQPGQMCVEAAVCYALGLPHDDDPGCVDESIRSLKIRINDSNWSSNIARAKGLRKLAVLQLGTKDNFNSVEFATKVALMTVNKIVSKFLRSQGKTQKADACEKAKTLAEAKSAANAAGYAADAVNAAMSAVNAADYATMSAVNAAGYAAMYANAAGYAAMYATVTKSDEYLELFAHEISEILIGMNVPGIKWLPLLD